MDEIVVNRADRSADRRIDMRKNMRELRTSEYSISSPKTPRMQKKHKEMEKELLKTPKIKESNIDGITIMAEDVESNIQPLKNVDVLLKIIQDVNGTAEKIKDRYWTTHGRDVSNLETKDHYEFDIKMLRGIYQKWMDKYPIPDEVYGETLAFELTDFADNLKSLYDWIEDWFQVGRSGGWLVLEADPTVLDAEEWYYNMPENVQDIENMRWVQQEVDEEIESGKIIQKKLYVLDDNLAEIKTNIYNAKQDLIKVMKTQDYWRERGVDIPKEISPKTREWEERWHRRGALKIVINKMPLSEQKIYPEKDISQQKVDSLRQYYYDLQKRTNMAKNRNTSPDILTELSKDEYWDVRYHVARNPNTPMNVIVELTQDIDEKVRENAKRNLMYKKEITLSSNSMTGQQYKTSNLTVIIEDNTQPKKQRAIDRLQPIPNLWYEDEEGNKIFPDLRGDMLPDDYMDGGYPYQHARFPVVRDSICTDEGELMSGETSMNCVEPIVIYLVTERKWTLPDAITVAATTCERCMNILLEETTGEPYLERDTAHTHCELCAIIDSEYDKKYKEFEMKNKDVIEVQPAQQPMVKDSSMKSNIIQRALKIAKLFQRKALEDNRYEEFQTNTFVIFTQDAKFKMDQLDGVGEIKTNMIGKIKKVNDMNVMVEVGKQLYEIPLVEAFKVMEPFRARVVTEDEGKEMGEQEELMPGGVPEEVPEEQTEPSGEAPEQARPGIAMEREPMSPVPIKTPKKPLEKALEQASIYHNMMRKMGIDFNKESARDIVVGDTVWVSPTGAVEDAGLGRVIEIDGDKYKVEIKGETIEVSAERLLLATPSAPPPVIKMPDPAIPKSGKISIGDEVYTPYRSGEAMNKGIVINIENGIATVERSGEGQPIVKVPLEKLVYVSTPEIEKKPVKVKEKVPAKPVPVKEPLPVDRKHPPKWVKPETTWATGKIESEMIVTAEMLDTDKIIVPNWFEKEHIEMIAGLDEGAMSNDDFNDFRIWLNDSGFADDISERIGPYYEQWNNQRMKKKKKSKKTEEWEERWHRRGSLKKESEYENLTVQTSDIPKEVKNQIKDIQSKIDKDMLYDGEDEEGWVEGGLQKLFHSTILYGINPKDKDSISNIVKEMNEKREIKAETGDIEYFDHEDKGYTAMVLRIESDGLKKLHDKLKSEFENKDKYPEYKSHVTIAYLKPNSRVEGITAEPFKWEIDDIEVANKDGSLTKVSDKGVVGMEKIILGEVEISDQMIDNDGMWLSRDLWEREIKYRVEMIEQYLGNVERGVNVIGNIRTYLDDLEEILEKIPPDQMSSAGEYLGEQLSDKPEIASILFRQIKQADINEPAHGEGNIDMKKPLKELNKIIKKRDKESLKMQKNDEKGRIETSIPQQDTQRDISMTTVRNSSLIDIPFKKGDKVKILTGVHKNKVGIISEYRHGYGFGIMGACRVLVGEETIWYQDKELEEMAPDAHFTVIPKSEFPAVEADIQAGFRQLIDEMERSHNPYVVNDIGRKLYKQQQKQNKEVVHDGIVSRI